jgi:hypothetical protein
MIHGFRQPAPARRPFDQEENEGRGQGLNHYGSNQLDHPNQNQDPEFQSQQVAPQSTTS